ncbi:MAG: imidazole glycerol phosphate synthase subunit HisH [Candidatus Omnitrophica bacterium]|nr:imidazole glycerol phosphate synthase subunit HisH [Candidatus Omnitrophota bacterium]
MIAIIDYGMGNLRSVQKALESEGAVDAKITQDVTDIQQAEKIVLPGVGAIQPAMEKLESLNIIPAIKETINSGKPFLGICLGFQLLFEKSNEGGNVEGLGILQGEVKKFSPQLKVPHMGWNQLNIKNPDCPLMNGIANQVDVYFCHSYYVVPNKTEISLTTTDYGIEFTSAIYKDNIYGMQFHPEKSQAVGLKILENFVKL